MPIQFYPRAGQILMCEFTGFVVPEMVKPRPVIVVSPRLPQRSEIVAIVPARRAAWFGEGCLDKGYRLSCPVSVSRSSGFKSRITRQAAR
jgi:uncharacterized protein YifN (PemK superfamily)